MCLKCEWCGTVDFNPIETEDRETGWRSVTCRRCGSDLVEAERCVECNDYFSEEIGDDFFHVAQGEGYCASCLKALCNTKTGLEYLRKFDLTDEFVDFLVDFHNLPFVKRVLLNFINSIDDEHEALTAKIWQYITDDMCHFADYIYNKSKGGDK